jgi:hypothetical protein
MSLLHRDARSEALAQLSCFRGEFYSCLTARSDALFELADAVLCGDGPVRSLAELSLVGEHRRGHGGLYAAMARGRIDARRLRRALSTWAMGRVWHRFTSRLRPSTLRGAFAWGTRRPLEVRRRQARHLSCAPAALWPFSPAVRRGYGSRQDRLRGRSARTPDHEAREGS